MRFLQALTRERCSRFIVASPSGPLSRLGKGVGRRERNTPVAALGRFCAQYGLILDSAVKLNSYPTQPATRGSWGRAPSVFGSFYTRKGTPRLLTSRSNKPKTLFPPSGSINFFIPPKSRLTTLPCTRFEWGSKIVSRETFFTSVALQQLLRYPLVGRVPRFALS